MQITPSDFTQHRFVSMVPCWSRSLPSFIQTPLSCHCLSDLWNWTRLWFNLEHPAPEESLVPHSRSSLALSRRSSHFLPMRGACLHVFVKPFCTNKEHCSQSIHELQDRPPPEGKCPLFTQLGALLVENLVTWIGTPSDQVPSGKTERAGRAP